MIYITHALCFLGGFSVIPIYMAIQMFYESWLDTREYKKKCDDYIKSQQ
jgi:hypothetical protein